jgi:UDP-2-acetamido-2-deoxy-ribo-hexuluronate aminotransferase
MIRLENNRADKLFLKEYVKEIGHIVVSMDGLDDVRVFRHDLEKEFARLTESKFAIAVNSGTDALQLSLLALGIGKGDSVIVPDVTYISSALAVAYVGAEPIFIDIKKDDLTINENHIKAHIRPNTKAVIMVHMFGQPCAVKKIKKICKENNLFLIEDACQSFGSTYNGRPVGSFGDMAAFSFSYYKPLSSLGGNGGMVVFQDKNYFDRINKYLDLWKQSIALCSLDRKFNKISLTDIATVKVKLKYKTQILAARSKIKRLYEKELASLKNISILRDAANGESVRENFPIMVEDRDRLHKFLLKKQIKTEMPYEPMHSLGLFKNNACLKEDFPAARFYHAKALHLPLFSFMNEKECFLIIASIKDFFSK